MAPKNNQTKERPDLDAASSAGGQRVRLGVNAEALQALAAMNLPELESAYEATVHAVDDALKPFYNDPEIREVIAQSSDSATALFRKILECRMQKDGTPLAEAIQLLASRSPQHGAKPE